jgi:hypothetical protein
MDAPHELGDLHDRDNGGPDGPLNGVASELRATSSSNGFGECRGRVGRRDFTASLSQNGA